MNKIIQLSEVEINTLVEIIKKNKESFRAIIILLSVFWKPSEIIKVFKIPPSSYYDRINRYKIEKTLSLTNKAKSGARKKLSEQKESELIKTVSQYPPDIGSSYSKWTCRNLKIFLGLSVSEELIRLKLHKNNKSWHKPRHRVDSPDPEKEIKMAKIKEVEENLKGNEVLLHQDESDFNLFCNLRNMWQDKGKQQRILTPGRNQKIYAFGAKDKNSDRFIYRVFERKRAVEFIKFMKHLLRVYQGKKIFMVVDNYVVHSCKKTLRFLEENKDKIELLFLPTYSPDENQVIERVWGTVKDWINCNYLFRDKNELATYVHKGLRQYQLFKINQKSS